MLRIPRNTPNSLPFYGRDRREGIAILIVLIIFVVLYLVVYQLHFSSTMEEHVAHVRFGEAEASIAMQSASSFVLTLLSEDIRSAGVARAAPTGMGLDGDSQAGRGSRAEGPSAEEEIRGTFQPLSGSSSRGAATWYDYINENIFKPNPKDIGDVTVKITITDGERFFDLNRLFDYVRLKDEEMMEGEEDLREDDLLAAVGGKSEEEAGQSLRDKILSKSKRKRTARAEDDDAAAEPGAITEDDYEEMPFLPPNPQREESTIEMLDRAINMMFLINEQKHGFLYPSGQRYISGQIARAIVDYVLDRRMAQYQNRIHLVSELLNIPGITAELYYGPMPRIDPGEEVLVGNFLLSRDEFGDVVPQYIYSDVDDFEAEQQAEEIGRLMQDDSFGRFGDFAGMGFDPLQANPMTRGMTESAMDVDEDGTEYVVQPPVAIGLKDLFTTFSSGKININTASVPVLHGLLLSLQQEGEADVVALDIGDYRNHFQEEALDDEGIGSVDSTREIPDLGQPRRKPRDPDEDTPSALDALMDGSALTGGVPGLDSEGFDGMESSYQNVETNYFTSLKQLELIDGGDGGPEDLLRSDEGVERVSEEDDTVLRRAMYDLEKVAVFGSSYFTAELKGKSKTGRSVKAGYLTVRRDVKKGVIEVLMWKSLQK